MAQLNSIEIELGALRKNCRALQKFVGSTTRILAVVKSDGYGHGMVPVARCLADEGITTFGVAEVAEGVLLRQAGITGDIVVFLGVRPEGVADVVKFSLQPVVYERSCLAQCAEAARKEQIRVGVHLKVDTGMGRLGIRPDEVADFAGLIEAEDGVELAGIMSHLPGADSASKQLSERQNLLFTDCYKAFGAVAEKSSVAHIANSAALLKYPEMHWNMVRPGITLYGCYPADCSLCRRDVDLQPVMSFKSKVIQVKEVPAGFGISYGHTYVTKRPSRLAVLPVGYNDGYLRSLSNKAQVLLRGKRAPQRGRVCMNITVIDVTDIPEVCVGDEVVLMGRQGGDVITADELAGWMGTISYEVLCLLGNRNPRVYI